MMTCTMYLTRDENVYGEPSARILAWIEEPWVFRVQHTPPRGFAWLANSGVWYSMTPEQCHARFGLVPACNIATKVEVDLS